MFSDDQLLEAKIAGQRRRDSVLAQGHSRKDGTEGSLGTDYLAALAEVWVRDFMFEWPKDDHPITVNNLGPDFVLPDRAIHVKHTTLPDGSMLLRDRDRPNIKSPKDLFILVVGDESGMDSPGYIYGEDFDDVIRYRWRWDQDTDGEVSYIRQNRLRDYGG